VLHQNLLEQKCNKAEQELFKRLEESVATAKNDLKLLREIWTGFRFRREISVLLGCDKRSPTDGGYTFFD
jgi:hypothetical protein